MNACFRSLASDVAVRPGPQPTSRNDQILNEYRLWACPHQPSLDHVLGHDVKPFWTALGIGLHIPF